MRNGWMVIIVAWVLWTQAVQLEAVEEKKRLWETADGQYSAVGILLEYERRSRTVTIEKEDGSKVQIVLSVLSKEDQRYVKRFQAARSKQMKTKDKEIAKPVNKPAKLKPNRRQANRNTDSIQMYGVNWLPKIEDALAVAGNETEAKSDGRPIMWFRVLGDLSGYM